LKNSKSWVQKQEEVSLLEGKDRFMAQLKLVEAQYNVLQRELETERILYDSIVTRMKEIDVTSGTQTNAIKVVEEGRRPFRPSKPDKLIIIMAALIIGTGSGVGLIFSYSLIDNRIGTIEQAEAISGLPILSALPADKRLNQDSKSRLSWMDQFKAAFSIDKLKGYFGNRSKDEAIKSIHTLVLLSDPSCQLSEAVRTLRASLKLAGKEEDKKVLLITSALPNEGKSFVSANTAVAFAKEGRNTLLIDADLRKPVIHKIFQIPTTKETLGLTSALTSDSPLESHFVDSNIDHLTLLPAGQIAPNPAELLANDSFNKLLQIARERFDRIIIDSAPVNPVADSLLILPLLDGCVLVADQSKTPKSAIQRTIDQIKKSGTSIIGLVMNKVSTQKGLFSEPSYYYYGSDSEYGNSYQKS
ncbi:MAG: polysaccharide biosynthesis tyrosine autokinase, partial [Verrucomicrobiota bacterium]